MRRYLMVMVCAAVLLAAGNAMADNYSVADEDLEAFMQMLGEEIQVQDQVVGIHDPGTLDACFLCRPAAFAVAFKQNGEWTPTTDIWWNDVTESYQVQWDEDLMTDVDGVRMWWKTSSAACCNYCDWEDWSAKYWDYPGGYTSCDIWWVCAPGSGNDIIYWGQETSFYDGWDFDYTTNYLIGAFNRDGSMTDSIINISESPE